MWAVWYVIGLIQIGLNRWFFHISDYNNYIHSFLGWFIFTSMTYDLSAILITSGSLFAGAGLFHKRIGWVMAINMFLLIGFGLASFVAKKVLKWDTHTLMNLKHTHRNLAFVFWILSLISI